MCIRDRYIRESDDHACCVWVYQGVNTCFTSWNNSDAKDYLIYYRLPRSLSRQPAGLRGVGWLHLALTFQSISQWHIHDTIGGCCLGYPIYPMFLPGYNTCLHQLSTKLDYYQKRLFIYISGLRWITAPITMQDVWISIYPGLMTVILLGPYLWSYHPNITTVLLAQVSIGFSLELFFF